jgi:glycosyltransferase involved in cell wall biosynthesis
MQHFDAAERRSDLPIRIATDIEGVVAAAQARGLATTLLAGPITQFIRQCLTSDVVIIGTRRERTYLACLLRPLGRFKLVSVDLILRPPAYPLDLLVVKLKALLLTQVDRFILYFKDISGYQQFYGLRPDRITYLPFKVNGWGEPCWPGQVPPGDHVLCAGRTLRDVSTFVEAMSIVGCPAVLLQQPAEVLHQHGTDAWTTALPANVRLVVDRSENLGDFLKAIAEARLVVIPRYRGDLAPTGISTYLVAMALGKCVVISRGPGADDVLSDEAAFVTPQDVNALATTVARLWHDDAARSGVAERGRLYAESLGGEQRLCADILEHSLRCLAAGRSQRADDNPVTRHSVGV